jgi:FKBP-type peptidyl-prolyl cis-trans isomerase
MNHANGENRKRKTKKAAKKAKKAEKKRRKAEKRLQKSASSASKSDSKSSSGEDESSPDDRSSAAGEGVARQFNDKPQSIRLLAKNSVGMVEKQCIAAPPPGIPASRPVKGSMVTVHFTGYLMPGLKQFYTTRQTETNKYANLFKFEMGVRKKMIEGWDIAIASMMLGEKARFTISGNYGYGVEGCAAYGIAPYSTLVYDIEIMKIE